MLRHRLLGIEKKSSKMGYILGKTGSHPKINAIMDNILAKIDMRTIRALD